MAVSWQRRDILGVAFDLIGCDAAMRTIDGWRRAGRREYVVVANPHSVLLCRRDPQMNDAVAQAGLTLPDGVGIVLAAGLLGYPHNGRVTGPELMLRLCDWGRGHGYRHFFYGGTAGVADRLAGRLSRMYPGLQVAGTFCPPFRPLDDQEDAEIVRQINDTRPDVVWVGLGAPKQEKWMHRHRSRIEAAAMIGVGAAFDFHSRSAAWAPAWMRRGGMEWAYRLARDPGRMWRRNLDSPLFLLRVGAQRLRTALLD
ncbi:MAG TPA: WecB/TagA/CpsF family glycosyltransferase [Phycisphaerae bacterium]|nr:WecB/TagA/CpsF family glycosyltransferase [Phycisphaerae bacterium]